MKLSLVLAFLGFIALTSATIYFQEDFGAGWEDRWVVSSVKEADGTLGKWVKSAGRYFTDEVAESGLQTSEDARFYQISAEFPKFSNKDTPLVIQYSVKYEHHADCGGAYIKLLPPGLDQTKFEGESEYNIMFGPDVCGTTRRVHAILNHKGTNHLVSKNPSPETNEFITHMYTFILNADQTYEILIDGESKQSGKITEDWNLLPPKTIPDPSVSKPEDWVDEAQIADPAAVKPAGWDDIPAEVVDPEATKPEDWDDELDGEWEAPLIANPEYKGEWKAALIDNPAYKGEWVHPEIANPEYVEDDSIAEYEHQFLGIEIWQVKAGTIFDNILITDDVEAAKAVISGPLKARQTGEQAGFDAANAAAKAKAEAEEAAEAEAVEADAVEADVEEIDAEEAGDDDEEPTKEGHDEL